MRRQPLSFALLTLSLPIAGIALGSCDSGPPPQCLAGARSCSGSTPIVCASDGSRWLAEAPCDDGQICMNGDCVTPSACGDGVCDPGNNETPATCPADCPAPAYCGDGTCALNQESCVTCPADCGQCCGNGRCDLEDGENDITCPTDCICSWQWEPKFMGEAVYGVWTNSPTSLFVYAESGYYRREAGAWSGPLFVLPVEVVWSFMGTGPNDLWFATTQGIWRYDGVAPAVIGSTTANTAHIWANTADDVWFVSFDDSAQGALLGHWQGASVDYTLFPSGFGTINDLWSDGAGTVWIGGSREGMARLPLLVEYSSSSKTFVERPVALGDDDFLDSLFGVGPDMLFLLTAEGTLWSYVPSATATHLIDFAGGFFQLWASSSKHAVVASRNGLLHEINTTTKQVSSREIGSTILAIWGLDAQNIWLATNDGLLSYTCQ